jgi:outer membrane protein assembly factor BamB
VLSLAVGPDGTVYAGTGPEGLIYRIPRAGAPEVFFRSPERYIQSLLVAPDGTVYAGTAESGLLYAIRPDGTARVLHDSDQSTITAIARDAEGNLYAATAPRGQIYRVSAKDLSVKAFWDKGKEAITALARDDKGRLYAATGASIVVLDADGEATTLSDSRRAQLMALDFASNGDLFAGSANVGSVYRLDAKAPGRFESVVHDARGASAWGAIRWRADGPADGVRLETRSGNTAEPDGTWSDWKAPNASGDGHRIASPPGRYLQYRVAFNGEGAELTTLHEVTVAYLPQNRPPTVKLTAPAGGEYLKGSAILRWTGADPDRDTLSYDLTYSADGKTWLPLGRPPSAPAGAPARGPEIAEAERRRVEEQLAANPALARFREALATDADVSQELRQETLKRADALIARYDGAQSAAPGAGAKASGLRESSFAWDTSKLPDGAYRVRVVASDRPSNPNDPASAEAISEPFVVANHAPAAFLFRRAWRETEGSGTRLDGLAIGRAPLIGAQFRVDGGDWMACEAADGIWDSAFEPFTCPAGPLTAGEHTVEVKVVDAAGNTTTRATAVKVN